MNPETRSSHQRCSLKKDVLENFAKFTGKHLWQSLFFNKVAGLRTATLLRKRLWRRYFPVNVVKFLRTPFLQNSSGRLLLWNFNQIFFFESIPYVFTARKFHFIIFQSWKYHEVWSAEVFKNLPTLKRPFFNFLGLNCARRFYKNTTNSFNTTNNKSHSRDWMTNDSNTYPLTFSASKFTYYPIQTLKIRHYSQILSYVFDVKTSVFSLHKNWRIYLLFTKDLFSKYDQFCSFLRIWSHLLKKYLMENFIFCEVFVMFVTCVISAKM